MDLLEKLNSVYKGWMSEYRFSDRKFRFDYANPELMIAVEIEGNVWHGGWHNTGRGYTKDMEKYNLAQIMGWKVLRYTTGQEEEMIRDIGIVVKEIISKSIK